MNTLTTNSELTDHAFVPMTEQQMETAKGGYDWPDWVDELVDLFADVVTFLETVTPPNPTPEPADPDQFWDDLALQLEASGYVPPTEAELSLDW